MCHFSHGEFTTIHFVCNGITSYITTFYLRPEVVHKAWASLSNGLMSYPEDSLIGVLFLHRDTVGVFHSLSQVQILDKSAFLTAKHLSWCNGYYHITTQVQILKNTAIRIALIPLERYVFNYTTCS